MERALPLGANDAAADRESRKRGWVDYLVILLLWAALYLPGLGVNEFRLEEPHRVEPAIGMLDSGNWSQPMVWGEPYYRKPPLTNWLIATGLWCAGGVSEFAARLPSVLLVLALALAARGTAGRWAGRGPALGAAIMVLSCSAMLDKGRLCEIEAGYTALSGIAMLVWLQGWAKGPLSAGRWAVIGLLLGAGVLAKGPPHLLFFYGLILVLTAADGRWRELLKLPHLVGVFCLAALALAWLWSTRAGLAQAKGTWASELVGRFGGAGGAVKWGKIFSNPLSSMLNLAPWVFLVLGRPWLDTVSEGQECARRFLRRVPWYVLAVIVILPMVPAYRPRYSMPAYAVAALTLAWWSEQIAPSSRTGRIWAKLILFAAVMALPAGAVSIWLNHGQWLWTALVLTGIGLGVAAWARRKSMETPLSRWHVTALALAALALTGWGIATPILARGGPYRTAAAGVAAHLAPGEKFVALRPGHLPFLIYLHGRFSVALDQGQLPDSGGKVLVLKRQLPAAGLTNRASRVLAEVGEEEWVTVLLELDPRPGASPSQSSSPARH